MERPPSSSSSSPLLEELAPDLQVQILESAGPHATAVFSGCCKWAQRLVRDHDTHLFQPAVAARPSFLSSPLPPPESKAAAVARNLGAALAFKDCLQLESWRDVYVTTQMIRLPCLGFFVVTPPEPADSLDDLRGTWGGPRASRMIC